MKLQSFVEQALLDIRLAVAGAQKKIQDQGLLVSPQVCGDSNTICTDVEFDVAVEASTEGSAKGEGGIKVIAGIFNAGGSAETDSKEKESRVSRVKFTIPLYLPPPVGTESEKTDAT